MNSTIFRTAARVLMPLLLVFATFLFLRGHNDPGGGFVAGLIVAIAFVLLMLADGLPAARRAALVAPQNFLGAGLIVALSSGLVPLFFGRPFLTACWFELGPPEWELLVGTPLFFDIGVCSVVIGVVLTMTFHLAED